MIAGVLQVTVAMDDNAGTSDLRHRHWGSSWSSSMLREDGCREHQRRCGRKLVMGFAVGTMGAQALTCHVVDVGERRRMRASIPKVTGDVQTERVIHFVSN